MTKDDIRGMLERLNANILEINWALKDTMHGRFPEEYGWQPIDTAPKSSRVLVYCDGFIAIGQTYLVTILFDGPSRTEWRDSDDGILYPTHWRHLPLPPTAKS